MVMSRRQLHRDWERSKVIITCCSCCWLACTCITAATIDSGLVKHGALNQCCCRHSASEPSHPEDVGDQMADLHPGSEKPVEAPSSPASEADTVSPARAGRSQYWRSLSSPSIRCPLVCADRQADRQAASLATAHAERYGGQLLLLWP